MLFPFNRRACVYTILTNLVIAYMRFVWTFSDPISSFAVAIENLCENAPRRG